MQYVTFLLNELLFGIPIYLVQEFSRTVPIYPIVGHDRRIAGFINQRGKIAAVLDLKQCLGLPNPEQPDSILEKAPSFDKKKVVMLETQDGLSEEALQYGITSFEEPLVLLVDRIYEIVTVETTHFYAPPAHIKEDFVEGVVKIEDNLLTIISIAKLTEDLTQETEQVA